MSVKSVLLKGNFAEGNFGDDALALCDVYLLEQAFSKIWYDGAVASAEARRRIGRWGLDRPSLIAYGGGTQFFSMKAIPVGADRPTDVRSIGALRHPRRLLDSLSARTKTLLQRGVPRIAVGMGVGPLDAADPDRPLIIDLFRSFDFTWVRDAKSLEFCERNDIRTRLLGSDLCFIEPFRNRILRGAPAADAAKTVGVVLRDHPALDRAFMGKIAELARGLRDSGHRVEFFSFSKKWDVDCAAALRAETFAQWDPDRDSVAEFAGRLGACDLILTARFHGGIFALLSGRPFVAIELEQKHRGLRELFDPPTPCFIDVDAPFERYRDVVETALAHSETLSRIADDARALQSKLADHAVDRLMRYFADGLSVDRLERQAERGDR